MAKPKENHDVISEEEFTIQEKDAGEEFLTGMSYQPIATEIADEEETLQNKESTLERPNNLVLTPQEPKFRVPTDVMIKSSEQPSPREDRDRKSSSN